MTERQAESDRVSVFDLIKQEEILVYCSWCGAEPGDPCREWDEPIDLFHGQRRAHLLDLRVALVAPALEEAGSWLAERRRVLTGRRYANAELFGEMIHARGDDVRWRSETDAKRIRLGLSSPGNPTDGA